VAADNLKPELTVSWKERIRRAGAVTWARWHQAQGRVAGWIARRRVAIGVVTVNHSAKVNFGISPAADPC
jgi:hypothetical protein